MSEENTAETAEATATKVKKGRGPTVARFQIVTGTINAPVIQEGKYISDTAALRAIERDKVNDAIGLFRPLAVEAKVTARLV